MSNPSPDFYLDLSGTPRELGRAHGEALRPTIQRAIGEWQDYLAEASGMPFAQLLGRFLDNTNYRPAIQQWAPHLAEEVNGIAEGADLDEDLAYAWQLVDEVIDFVIEYIYIEKCTTLGGYDQGPGQAPVIAKTQDLMHCYIGAGALVRTRYADSDIDILNSTIAGIVAQDGMSRHLGICLNHIGKLDRSPGGLPVSYICRLLFERCNNIAEGADFLRQVTHASGMNYGLIDRDTVRTFEASAGHLEEFLPAPALKRIWHTNHPLVNQNYCRNAAMWDALADTEAGNTEARMAYLDREMVRPEQAVTVERAIELLSSREVPISAEAEDAFPTVNGLVMEFSDEPTLLFAPGPPSREKFLAFRFD